MNEDENVCRCDGDLYGPHPCPYQSDVNDDHDFECSCCPKCEQDCADDI